MTWSRRSQKQAERAWSHIDKFRLHTQQVPTGCNTGHSAWEVTAELHRVLHSYSIQQQCFPLALQRPYWQLTNLNDFTKKVLQKVLVSIDQHLLLVVCGKTHTNTHTHTRTHIHRRARTHARAHIHTHTRTRTNTRTHIHRHARARRHPPPPTHTHTHTQTGRSTNRVSPRPDHICFANRFCSV